MGSFERWLSLWVALAIAAGMVLGQRFPGLFTLVGGLAVAQINLVIAALIWPMIYPMMLAVDFGAVRRVGRNPQPLLVTVGINWLVKPFTMALLAWLFIRGLYAAWIPPELADELIAGMILLGVAHCTAMVFVWSQLCRGNATYTLVQVAVKDLIMVVAGWLTRHFMDSERAIEHLEQRLKTWAIVGLLGTVALLFGFQAGTIAAKPGLIVLVAIPLILQTLLIFLHAALGMRACRQRHDVAAPGALIGASNFFELAVAVAISLFGVRSGTALATVVGVLVEVPVMLALVAIASRSAWLFPYRSPEGGGSSPGPPTRAAMGALASRAGVSPIPRLPRP